MKRFSLKKYLFSAAFLSGCMFCYAESAKFYLPEGVNLSKVPPEILPSCALGLCQSDEDGMGIVSPSGVTFLTDSCITFNSFNTSVDSYALDAENNISYLSKDGIISRANPRTGEIIDVISSEFEDLTLAIEGGNLFFYPKDSSQIYGIALSSPDSIKTVNLGNPISCVYPIEHRVMICAGNKVVLVNMFDQEPEIAGLFETRNPVRSIAFISSEWFVYSTDNEITVVSEKLKRIKLADIGAKSLAYSDFGNLWFLTEDGGVFIINGFGDYLLPQISNVVK